MPINYTSRTELLPLTPNIRTISLTPHPHLLLSIEFFRCDWYAYTKSKNTTLPSGVKEMQISRVPEAPLSFYCEVMS